MPESPFITPRFVGPRFDQHTLPVEVTKDLAAYQTLIVELAKHLYLNDHPERQRTPRGFGASFELHLAKVEDGSAKAALLAVTAAVSLEPNAAAYFEQARELVTECIAAPAALPEAFPKDFLWYFNQVGSSLKEDESLELPGKGGITAVLTPARRKSLVLARNKVYEKPVELQGSIGQLDWENNTFRLRMSDGSQAIVALTANFTTTNAQKYGGSARHQVTVKCIASYNSYEQLQKVDQVESITVQPNYEIATKLDALASLEDGWLDGDGIALSKDALAEVTKMMVHHYPVDLKLPAIVPTPEGNILFEWRQAGTPSLDLDLSTMQAAFHAFALDKTDIEQLFTLKKDQDWQVLFAFLSNHIESVQA